MHSEDGEAPLLTWKKKAASIFISWQVKSLLPSSSKPIVTLLVTLRAMMPAT